MEKNFPTEVIELPSKGLIYPEENPLSSGKIEMKYMTAREEDILTNQSYIQNGTVLDKLMKSHIFTENWYKFKNILALDWTKTYMLINYGK